jgi:two-component system osmolarity sensor histidine kinase EnvZ
MDAVPQPAVTHPEPPHTFKWHFNRFLERHMPEGLYPRSLIIVITPMVLLQSIMAFTFMERHWEHVTKALSRSVAQEISFVVELHDDLDTTPTDEATFIKLVNQRLDLGFSILHDAELPPPAAKPFFSLLDMKLSGQITKRVGLPFWIDTVGRTGYVDIRIKVGRNLIFRFVPEQSRAYASNTPIFILWMVGSAIVLLWVAIIFLRNQIRPIQQLANAAHMFGMGREVPEFRPKGASEVQSAARAVLYMKERIERHIEQRTAMLAGVSHDLRTVLTRFKLQLAFLDDTEQVAALHADVDEMQHMLEDYLAFVRGDGGEASMRTSLSEILERVKQDAGSNGAEISVDADPTVEFDAKPNAFKRCVANLVGNACRFGDTVKVTGRATEKTITVIVEDDGPGIDETLRADVFRPFFRIDDARNQDEGGSGLGLAIALDIARSHGGDITLSESALGGLKAMLKIPR